MWFVKRRTRQGYAHKNFEKEKGCPEASAFSFPVFVGIVSIPPQAAGWQGVQATPYSWAIPCVFGVPFGSNFFSGSRT
jgi:hypothetical protein